MKRQCLCASLFIYLFLLSSCSINSQALRKPIDLSHSFDENTIYWPTEKGFIHEKEHFGINQKGYFYSAYRFCGPEHGGTHIDAPIHFRQDGLTLDQIPLTRLVGPGVLVDVSEAALKNRDYLISVEDLLSWEKEQKQTLKNKIVLLKTGYARYWPNRLKYMGTDKLGKEAIKYLRFPGLDPQAARFLVKERKIRAVGIDTPSIDYGQSENYESHRVLAEFNVPAFENVAHLDLLPTFGFEIFALPMKIKDGSGGPLRIIALVP